MTKKTAGLLFLGTCILLAILLLAQVISTIVSACVFALALVILGGLSQGFRRTK